MIFALLDYLQFRLQKGVYSPNRIKDQGGKLSIESNFPDYKKHEIGNIFFLHGRDSIKSWGVMYYTNSIWSHTGMFTENSNVTHATTGGVVEHDFAHLLDGESYISIMQLKETLTEIQKEKMLEFSRDQIGCGFNWNGVIKMWISILVGSHAQFRIQYWVDIILLILPLFFLAFIDVRLSLLPISLITLYTATVVANLKKRKSMRERMV